MIEDLLESNTLLEDLSATTLKPIVDAYKKTISIKVDNEQKSNYPASEFFTDESISKCHNYNLRMLDTASGTLVGLGLLGTFAGLTAGIINFQSGSADQIQESI